MQRLVQYVNRPNNTVTISVLWRFRTRQFHSVPTEHYLGPNSNPMGIIEPPDNLKNPRDLNVP